MSMGIVANQSFLLDLQNSQDTKAPKNLGLNGKKLILHLDVNGTIIGTDSKTDRDMRDIAQEALGRQIYDCWPIAGDRIKFMSYRDYVYGTYIKGSYFDSNLKKRRLEEMGKLLFTLKQMKSDYLEDMEKVVNLFEKKCGNKVFDSFTNLIIRLKKEKKPFQIHLHSFGDDMKEASQQIEKDLGIKFADTIYVKNGIFEGIHPNHQMQRVYKMCTEKNYLFQHDWKHWNANREKPLFGKVIPLNPQNEEYVSMFFDDNLKRSKNDPTGIGMGYDIKRDTAVPLDELLTNGNFVNVDTVEAAINPHYFESQVAKCSSFMEEPTWKKSLSLFE